MSRVEEEPSSREWFRTSKFKGGYPKTATLHYYFHDTLSGQNPSAVRVVPSPVANRTFTFFGQMTMVDNPLTAGPDPSSRLVGRAQGLYASAGLEQLSLLMVMNLYFPDGPYKGSTLALLGRNAALEKYREMPIIGGTGVFRFASGVALANTYSLDLTTGDAVVEYHVLVSYF
ncbi:dirigent protein 23-like [Malania oleifera]|uniref:dirigent protein 23-like n=1 Tax=Malania oleifera TaxID=397392 RepID=UPI0025AE1429|nr:dirigent protein 23-like [Malania oleifera]